MVNLSQADMNIFMFSLGTYGAPAVLSSTGVYHAADMITKFISSEFQCSLCASRLSINTTTKGVNASQASRSPEFENQQLFFTSSGCIGLVTEVDRTLAERMKALDHELANLVEGKHGRSHTM
jgi:hypothetical protein